MSVKTVTMEGVTARQPGVCVSVQTPGWHGQPAVLSVFRPYNDLKNEWGGRGVHKHCDGHGRVFDSAEAAWAFCLDRGYLKPYRCALRQKRKLEARDPRLPRMARG